MLLYYMLFTNLHVVKGYNVVTEFCFNSEFDMQTDVVQVVLIKLAALLHFGAT